MYFYAPPQDTYGDEAQNDNDDAHHREYDVGHDKRQGRGADRGNHDEDE